MRDASPAPRLVDIDPARVALSVAGVVVHRTARDARRLGFAVKLPDPPVEGMRQEDAVALMLVGSEPFCAARALAEWAKTGQGAPVAQIGVLLAEVRADLDGRAPEAARRYSTEPTTAAEVVVLAAGARLAVVEGRPVTAVELAVLAGRDERTIRAAVAANTLQPIDGGRPMRFAADVASRYLHARTVAGFVSPDSRRSPVGGSVATWAVAR